MTTVLHGPVMAHLLESFAGREYIRAFGQQERISEHTLGLLELSARAQVLNIGLQRWLALQLELLGAATLLCVAVLCVAVRGKAPLGMSGLALSYALTLTALAKYLVNYGTRANAQLASVERMHALVSLPLEEDEREEEGQHGPAVGQGPPEEWPSRGLLLLQDYRPAAYTANGPETLRPLTLTVQPGEHLALVGRTGSGKSTLLAGICRLLPASASAASSSSLSLDGREAASVSLSRWRGAVRCIPQQPLLLAGSIARNLDPECSVPTARLWEALRLAGLEAVVAGLPQQLDAHVQPREGELLLSAGQRQLLVLARLLLHRETARLVLLDEPDAGMEPSEGTRLHSVVHEHLAHATAIAITHRVLPLLHLFSRVLVLGDGQCVEDGTPGELIQRPGGHLHGMLAHAPARVQAHVRRMVMLQRNRHLPGMRAMWRRVSTELCTLCSSATCACQM